MTADQFVNWLDGFLEGCGELKGAKAAEALNTIRMKLGEDLHSSPGPTYIPPYPSTSPDVVPWWLQQGTTISSVTPKILND